MLRVDPKKDRATNDGKFQPGDPASGRLPTRVSAEWLNAVQDEIVNVIEGRKIALDPRNSGQLLQAILDIYHYGVEPKVYPISNGVETKTDLPLEPFDSSKLKMVFFNAVSVRHTSKADMSYLTSHVAVCDPVTSKWSLVTLCNPFIAELATQPQPGSSGSPAKPVLGPHLLSLSSGGRLQYQTLLLDGDNHQGSLTLAHFKYVRV